MKHISPNTHTHTHTKENENGKRKDCDESLPKTNKGNEKGMKNDVRKTRTKEDGKRTSTVYASTQVSLPEPPVARRMDTMVP